MKKSTYATLYSIASIMLLLGTIYCADGSGDPVQGPPGRDGTDGVSIRWLGSLPSAPASPALNDAYFNTTDGISYIWDGDSWEILAKVESRNVSGTVAPGDYLPLVHNLSRDNLTFSAQYLEDGYLYDYSDYQGLYGPKTALTVFSSAVANGQTYDSTTVSAGTLANGNFVIAWAEGTIGQFTIYSSADYSIVNGPLQFNNAATDFIKVSGMPGSGTNDFVIAWYDSGGIKFAIYNGSGGSVIAATVVDAAGVGWIGASALNNGWFVIAYRGSGGQGKFAIYDGTGTQQMAPANFGSGNVYQVECARLQKSVNNFVIAFGDAAGANDGQFAVYNAAGTLQSGPTSFWPNVYNVGSSAIASLKNGSFITFFHDEAYTHKMMAYVFSADYQLIFSTLAQSPTETNNCNMGASAVNDADHVLLAFQDGQAPKRAVFTIYNEAGGILHAPDMASGNNATDNEAAAGLSLRRFVLAYRDTTDANKGKFVIIGDSYLALQRVSSDEIRLYNYTSETLDLMLSLDP